MQKQFSALCEFSRRAKKNFAQLLFSPPSTVHYFVFYDIYIYIYTLKENKSFENVFIFIFIFILSYLFLLIFV